MYFIRWVPTSWRRLIFFFFRPVSFSPFWNVLGYIKPTAYKIWRDFSFHSNRYQLPPRLKWNSKFILVTLFSFSFKLELYQLYTLLLFLFHPKFLHLHYWKTRRNKISQKWVMEYVVKWNEDVWRAINFSSWPKIRKSSDLCQCIFSSIRYTSAPPKTFLFKVISSRINDIKILDILRTC